MKFSVCNRVSVLNVDINAFRWPAIGIHGDKSQQERDSVLNCEFCFCVFELTKKELFFNDFLKVSSTVI